MKQLLHARQHHFIFDEERKNKTIFLKKELLKNDGVFRIYIDIEEKIIENIFETIKQNIKKNGFKDKYNELVDFYYDGDEGKIIEELKGGIIRIYNFFTIYQKEVLGQDSQNDGLGKIVLLFDNIDKLSDEDKKDYNNLISVRDRGVILIGGLGGKEEEYLYHTNSGNIILQNHDYIKCKISELLDI